MTLVLTNLNDVPSLTSEQYAIVYTNGSNVTYVKCYFRVCDALFDLMSGVGSMYSLVYVGDTIVGDGRTWRQFLNGK